MADRAATALILDQLRLNYIEDCMNATLLTSCLCLLLFIRDSFWVIRGSVTDICPTTRKSRVLEWAQYYVNCAAAEFTLLHFVHLS